MEIKFYTPEYETIPTQLRLKVDGTTDVYYKRVEGHFAYDLTLFTDNQEKRNAIVEEVIRILIDQSEDNGSRWVEYCREILNPGEDWYEPFVIRVYFRMRDSW